MGTGRRRYGFALEDDEARGRIVSSDSEGVLTDADGMHYRGTFDGHEVSFTTREGVRSTGRWIPGSGPFEGIVSGGALGKGFRFTFLDHGAGNQRLNARFSFDGSVAEAVAALAGASYTVSRWDNWLNRRHTGPGAGGLIHLRSRGHWLTGSGSGHALLETSDVPVAPARGSVHVGEHNPTMGLGVGLVLHLVETSGLMERISRR